jgi:hypothetical protein
MEANLGRMSASLNWREPWFSVVDMEALRAGAQRELDAEVGPQHPLWGRKASVFGRSRASDDILVAVDDNQYAVVHLVWHGRVDRVPDVFPATTFFESLDAVQSVIDETADE